MRAKCSCGHIQEVEEGFHNAEPDLVCEGCGGPLAETYWMVTVRGIDTEPGGEELPGISTRSSPPATTPGSMSNKRRRRIERHQPPEGRG